jgi:hypothetical protein
MAGLGDLFGHSGVLEQLVVWGMLNQAVGAATDPALTALKQDVDQKRPVLVLDPVTLADMAVRGMATVEAARADAAKSGIDAARFDQLLALHTVRLSPADLAEAVLRSYVTEGQAHAQVKPQGVSAADFAVLTQLAGDGISPQDAARALLRGLIHAAGKGADATSYEQAIAESRLHDKWGPVLRELAKQLLSPADTASAVVRNFLDRGAARKIAAEQGVDAATLDTLIHLSGDAPAPGQLAEALRRGAIVESGAGPDSTSFEQGIAEGRLADKWAPVIKDLATLWPTPVDALDAQVKGQLTPEQAHQLYAKLGGDPQFEDWLYNSIGEGPTPLEAALLAARDIIPWTGTGPDVTSYEQAVRESHYRNKWTEAYRRLSEHIPPPSTIGTMLAHQVIDEKQAHLLLLQNNMSEADAAAYIAEAQYEAISDYRGLTQSAVVDMYYAHLLSRDQATQVLAALHVTNRAAVLLLDYADLRAVVDSVNRSVQRIATLYTSRKISTATARGALLKLQIPAGTIDQIIQDWEIQAAANVKVLTASEIVSAWYYGNVTVPEAIELLGAIGYTAFDAWVLLSNKAKGPLPGRPPNTAAAPAGAVIPGTT